jgi:hypothetical protein
MLNYQRVNEIFSKHHEALTNTGGFVQTMGFSSGNGDTSSEETAIYLCGESNMGTQT